MFEIQEWARTIVDQGIQSFVRMNGETVLVLQKQ